MENIYIYHFNVCKNLKHGKMVKTTKNIAQTFSLTNHQNVIETTKTVPYQKRQFGRYQ